MPRYYFHVRDSRDIPDRVGIELAGSEQVCAEVIAAAGSMLKDLGQDFWRASEWDMHVTDEHGATVCTLTIRGTIGKS